VNEFTLNVSIKQLAAPDEGKAAPGGRPTPAAPGGPAPAASPVTPAAAPAAAPAAPPPPGKAKGAKDV